VLLFNWIFQDRLGFVHSLSLFFARLSELALETLFTHNHDDDCRDISHSERVRAQQGKDFCALCADIEQFVIVERQKRQAIKKNKK
jgi:hypothetical protein